jgi:hypothetical protein
MWRDKGGIFAKAQGCIMMVVRGRNVLGRSWVHTGKVMPHSWNRQGNDYVGWALGNQQTSGSDVTSCSNENPSITPFFPVAYLE